MKEKTKHSVKESSPEIENCSKICYEKIGKKYERNNQVAKHPTNDIKDDPFFCLFSNKLMMLLRLLMLENCLYRQMDGQTDKKYFK